MSFIDYIEEILLQSTNDCHLPCTTIHHSPFTIYYLLFSISCEQIGMSWVVVNSHPLLILNFQLFCSASLVHWLVYISFRLYPARQHETWAVRWCHRYMQYTNSSIDCPRVISRQFLIKSLIFYNLRIHSILILCISSTWSLQFVVARPLSCLMHCSHFVVCFILVLYSDPLWSCVLIRF